MRRRLDARMIQPCRRLFQRHLHGQGCGNLDGAHAIAFAVALNRVAIAEKEMPMPGQRAVKPRLSSSILMISTFNISPALEPRTSIGPVAPLTNGMVTSASVSCCPRWRIVLSLMLIAHSTTKVSPGSTLAMKRSSPESAYLMLPTLLTL